jgi:hypothetical protein
MAINTYDEFGVAGAGNLGRFQYTGQTRLPELAMYYRSLADRSNWIPG